MNKSETIDNLIQLTRNSFDYFVENFGKGFSCYYRDVIRGEKQIRRFIQSIAYYCDHMQAYRKVIADCGAGYGLKSIIMKLLGAQTVFTLDNKHERSFTANKLSDALQMDQRSFFPLQCSAENLPMESTSVDCITAFDSISHIGNPEYFFKETYRVLKNDGILCIEDGANTLDILSFIERKKYWQQREYGPFISYDGIQYVPYYEKRKKIVIDLIPDASRQTIQTITEATKGLWGNEIRQAVREYQEKGRVFVKPEFFCKDPVTGEAMERCFNPFVLAKTIEQFGFRVSLIKPYINPENPLRRLAVNTALFMYPLSMFIMPKFALIARKIHVQ
ncbi:MAG: methyltransferase domain-containing protein [Elusimicrobia bacterium]|nr:methyltransferase domain-containing protein [Elusimicrobiota bacterium]MBD3412739.1 methyltransferase domain-containing protein [Elusimicrobiota bacterium]